jgi:hypothetical protein
MKIYISSCVNLPNLGYLLHAAIKYGLVMEIFRVYLNEILFEQ